MRIRPGGPADAKAILAVHVRARRHAYADFLPYEELFGEEDERLARWEADLAGRDGAQVLVAEREDGAVCGAAVAGPARDGDRAGDGELRTLYVDPPAQGAGLGTRLHDAALADLAARGFPHAVVWLYARNEAAAAFYAARGWRPDPAPAGHPWGCDTRLRIALEP